MLLCLPVRKVWLNLLKFQHKGLNETKDIKSALNQKFIEGIKYKLFCYFMGRTWRCWLVAHSRFTWVQSKHQQYKEYLAQAQQYIYILSLTSIIFIRSSKHNLNEAVQTDIITSILLTEDQKHLV
jgi:hypothetical protein